MYYGSELLLFTRKLNCLQTFWQITVRQVIGPYFVQKFRPIPLTVFEILGFKLKNKNDNDNNKNWRNRLFAISPMFVIQFSPNFRYTYILTLAIILWCQKWISTESESANRNFRMYRHNGPRPRPSLYYTKYYCTLYECSCLWAPNVLKLNNDVYDNSKVVSG